MRSALLLKAASAPSRGRCAPTGRSLNASEDRGRFAITRRGDLPATLPGPREGRYGQSPNKARIAKTHAAKWVAGPISGGTTACLPTSQVKETRLSNQKGKSTNAGQRGHDSAEHPSPLPLFNRQHDRLVPPSPLARETSGVTSLRHDLGYPNSSRKPRTAPKRAGVATWGGRFPNELLLDWEDTAKQYTAV